MRFESPDFCLEDCPYGWQGDDARNKLITDACAALNAQLPPGYSFRFWTQPPCAFIGHVCAFILEIPDAP